MANRKVQIESELNSAGVRKGAGEIKDAVKDMSTAVSASTAQAAKGVAGVGAGADQAAAKIAQADNKIIASIQRRIAATEALGKGEVAYQEALLRNRGQDVERFRPYLDQLAKAEAAQRAATGSLDTMGMSARATTAALRQVPAQFTDIVTSLASGQAPLTVFLQQGGQLKDVFGGAGNAARALGGYVLGLVNPLTIAAAAAAGLAYAYNQGANEGQAFQRTVILTGGAAGVTAGQLSDMAKAIKDLGGGTAGRAAEILNQMAQSGLTGASSLQKFTEQALRLEKVGGPAAEETAKAFAELGKSPFEAAVKLNAATGAFTASVISQIKALEDQGRATEAARVAQEAFFASGNERAPALAANLGLVERGWLGIKDAVKGAYDSLLQVGRTEGLQQQIQAAQNAIALRQAGNFGQAGKDEIPALQEQLRLLSRRAVVEGDIAAAQGQQKKQADALGEFLKDQDRYLTSSAQKAKAIAQAIEDAGKAGSADSPRVRELLAARLAAIEQQFDPGTNLQAIKNAEALRLEILKRGESEIQLLRARGAIGAREEIERNTQQELAAIAIRRNAVAQELALASKRINSEKEVSALRGELATLDAQRVTAQAKGAAQIEIALQKQRNAAQDVIQAQREMMAAEIEAAYRERDAAIAAVARSTDDYARSIAEEADQLQLELSLLGSTNETRAARLAQYRIELDLKRRLREIDSLQGVDEAERARLSDAARAVAAQASAQATTRAYLDEWQKTADQINSSLTDALLRGFEDGKGFAQNFADTVKNLFKTLVLRPVVQGVVNEATGFLGLGSASSGGTAATGMQAVQAAQSLASLYNYGTAAYGYAAANGYLGANAAYQAAAQSALATSGNVYAGGAAASSTASLSSISAGTWAAAIVAGIYKANQDYSAGFGIAQSRNVGRETGGLSGTFEGFQAGIFQSLGFSDRLASLLSGSTAVAALIGRAAPQITGRGITGTLTAGDFTGTAFADIFEKGGLFRSDRRTTQTAELPGDIGRFLDDAASGIFDKAKAYGEALGLPGAALGSVTTQLKITLSDDAEKNKAAILEALSTYGDALVSGFSNQVAPLQLYGETVAQTLARVGGSLVDVNDVLSRIGVSGLQASIGGGKAAVGLTDLFGGLQGLQQAASGYFDNFFTEAEKTAAATAQLTSAFGGVGLAVPATREAFKSLVNGLDLTSEAGRNQFGVLLSLQGVFADLVPATEAAVAATRSAVDIQRERAGLETDLLRLQGNTAAIRAQERAALDESNRAIYDQIQALTDQQKANEAAAASAQQIAAQRSSLEAQLLQLQGNTVEIRARERAALDESNRALYDQVNALQDKAAAAQVAAAAAQERTGLERQLLELQGNTQAIRALERAALSESNRDLYDRVNALRDEQAAAAAATAAAQKLAAERGSLETELLRLQGDTVALRERERNALDPANRALFDQVQALQDQIAATQEAARAADDLKRAWQSTADSIFGEAKRIRDLISGGGGASTFAGAQSAFALATAQARAGDQEAAKLLPGLSQTLLGLAESQAGSLLDLQRIRSQTAASLERTGGSLVSSFGINGPETGKVGPAVGLQATSIDTAGVFSTNVGSGGDLLNELRGLRADNAAQAQSIAALELRTAKLLERWDADGMPETRTTA